MAINHPTFSKIGTPQEVVSLANAAVREAFLAGFDVGHAEVNVVTIDGSRVLFVVPFRYKTVGKMAEFHESSDVTRFKPGDLFSATQWGRVIIFEGTMRAHYFGERLTQPPTGVKRATKNKRSGKRSR